MKKAKQKEPTYELEVWVTDPPLGNPWDDLPGWAKVRPSFLSREEHTVTFWDVPAWFADEIIGSLDSMDHDTIAVTRVSKRGTRRRVYFGSPQHCHGVATYR